MRTILLVFISTMFFIGCIGEDILEDRIDPTIQITSTYVSLPQDTSLVLDYQYLDFVGRDLTIDPLWSSSNPDVISIDQNGKLTTLSKGQSTITISFVTPEEDLLIEDSLMIEVDEKVIIEPTSKSGTIRTTSSYRLSGAFTIEPNPNGGILIEIEDDYVASSSLPGLYLYLTNNPNSTRDALEVGRVTVFRGAHSYTVPEVDINTYSHLLYFCKPFNVKVGEGAIN